MKLIVCKSEEELDLVAANSVIKAINANPEATLGLATGQTPIGLYQKMVRFHLNKLQHITLMNMQNWQKIIPKAFIIS